MLLVRARCGLRGGNANNGLNAGFGYVNVNNAVGNANTNYGGRLHALQSNRFNSSPDSRWINVPNRSYVSDSR